MSWSRSASGTPAEVREAMTSWKADVAALDTKYGANETTVARHGEQVDSGVQSITDYIAAIGELPEGTCLSVNAGGSCGTDIGGRVNSDSRYFGVQVGQ